MMQRRSIKTRRCRRGDWHVPVDFRTMCNVLCLSQTALLSLSPLNTLCSLFFPLALSLFLSIKPDVTQCESAYHCLREEAPRIFREVIKQVHAVNYRAVIDLSVCAQSQEDLKENRVCAVDFVDFLRVCRFVCQYGFNLGLDV